MELNKNQIKATKGVAILFMLLLHLFCTKDYIGLYEPILFIGEVPLVYYLALFGDCCVAIYCFCSGYGLMINYINDSKNYIKKNLIRILKLYINFWIILFIFVVFLGIILGKANEYPGDLKTFMLTFLGVSPAYNGAWWFFTTYIILVLISPFINKLIIKHNLYFIVTCSFIFYFFAYVQRIKSVIVFNNEFLNWGIRQLALLGTSQLPFVIGAIFIYKGIYSKINSYFKEIKYKNIVCIFIILLMIIGHGIVETLFIAVFTGVIFICVFNIMEKPKFIDNAFEYIGEHSTNLWLTHMFFYMIFFKEIVFAPKYSFLIFPWLVLLCLISSYIIKFIEKPIIKKLDQYLNKNKAMSL